VSAADLLEDTFPHGTMDGYRQGCKTGHCPAPITCTVVRTRYAADWAFRKRVDAGWTVAQLAAADKAEAEQRKQAEREANRRIREQVKAEKRAAAKAAEQRPWTTRAVRAGTRDDRGRTRKTNRLSTPFTAAEVAIIRARNAEGVSDVKIGRELGRNTGSVWAKRTELGIAAIPTPALVHGTVRGYNRGCRGSECPNTPTCQQVMSEYKRARHAERRAAA